jgi:SAM-dependent methyltransferase
MENSNTEEAYIVDRYQRLWQRWRPVYDYKHVKGARISEILDRSGGHAPLALELGVGPGGIAAALSRKGMRVVGIDLSADALARAKEHCREDRVDLLRGSGFSLPLRDRSLPLVYASQVLHLFDLEGRSAIAREVYRVLKPGGRFVFDMKNASSHLLKVMRYSAERRHKNFPPQSEILGLLGEAGFTGVTRAAGVFPVVPAALVPNVGLLRSLAHTTFFVARRPA